MTRLCWVLLLVAVASARVSAGELAGRVVSVTDGDTLTIQTETRVRIRLAEIDAPERDQPAGQRAKYSLDTLCRGKEARVSVSSLDQYGRSVGRVWCAGTDVNAEQVRRGMAWVYTRYSTDQALDALQAAARQARRGLWIDSSPIPPWEWRQKKRSRVSSYVRPEPSSRSQGVDGQSFRCDGRRYCGQMHSKAEALFFMKNCPNTKMDGDHDGIPCERQFGR